MPDLSYAPGRGTTTGAVIERTARRYGPPVQWHAGFELVGNIDARSRGPAIPLFADRIHRDTGWRSTCIMDPVQITAVAADGRAWRALSPAVRLEAERHAEVAYAHPDPAVQVAAQPLSDSSPEVLNAAGQGPSGCRTGPRTLPPTRRTHAGGPL